jgi:hypothetical protein
MQGEIMTYRIKSKTTMLNEAEFNWPLRHAMWVYASLHATKLGNLLISPDTHLSQVYMYYGHTPEWADHLQSFGQIAIVKSTTKMKAKLANKEFPAIYLGPSVDHKGDTYDFWNPKTKHSLESCSAVFLQQNYVTFNKLDKSEIATQFAAITDKLTQMYDTDKDVTPVDDEGNNLPNLTHLEDEESYVSDGCHTEVEENFDIEEYDYEDEENFPPVIRDTFSGVPRSIRMLETFYNPCPYDEWKDEKGETG